MIKITTCTDDTIAHAGALIRNGNLVAFPTETVYGLGANALDCAACAKIFTAKGRPQFNPLITHVATTAEAQHYVEMTETAYLLAKHFWPGPLTMILPRKEHSPLSDLTTAGLPTSAIRVPSGDVAQKLIRAANVPIAAPSANKSGTLSPTTPAHVADSLGESIAMILAGGSCDIGLESTVIDLSTETPLILRPGGVTADSIKTATGLDIRTHTTSHTVSKFRPKSPGQLLKHYAPNIPVRLNAIDIKEGEALLAFGSIKFMAKKSGGSAGTLPHFQIRNLSETADLNEAATNLFRMLRELDTPSHSAIAVMNIPNTGLGIAINDRLHRAAEQ